MRKTHGSLSQSSLVRTANPPVIQVLNQPWNSSCISNQACICDPNDDAIEWDLTLNLEDGSTDAVANGAIKFCSEDKGLSLVHETICIPKEGCATFNIDAADMASTNPWISYSLKVDDIFYRDGVFSRWEDITKG